MYWPPKGTDPFNCTDPLNEVPLNEVPLNEVPLNEVPLNEVSLNEVPLNEGPLNEVPLNVPTLKILHRHDGYASCLGIFGLWRNISPIFHY